MDTYPPLTDYPHGVKRDHEDSPINLNMSTESFIDPGIEPPPIILNVQETKPKLEVTKSK